MDGPNPLAALWSMLRARRLRRPDPSGILGASIDGFDEVLDAVARGGVAAIPEEPLTAYLRQMERADPDAMSGAGSLSYWLNLYNAGALDLARRSFASGAVSVLEVPGAFRRPFIEVSGEHLSLDGIEHGKIRRFGDPRIHAALVCGSVSCPTLRHEPYREADLDAQLGDQIRSFLAAGAAVADHAAGTIALSRVFRWYGADFARPSRMPTLLPSSSRRVLAAIHRWLPDDVAAWVTEAAPRVVFQEYDWRLGCAVRPG